MLSILFSFCVFSFVAIAENVCSVGGLGMICCTLYVVSFVLQDLFLSLSMESDSINP